MADGPSPTKRPRQDDDVAETDHRAVKRPLLDYTHTTTISVFVGPEEKQFVVHKNAICAKSKFFKAACSTHWKEGQEKIVRLPEVEEKAFQSYVNWAYSEILVAEPTLKENVRMMIKLYLLGDKLDDIKLRNKTLKALHNYSAIDKIQPGHNCIRLIWAETPPSSLLRKWALDATILKLRRNYFEKVMAYYPSEFVQELALKSLRQIPIATSKNFKAKLPQYLEADEEV